MSNDILIIYFRNEQNRLSKEHNSPTKPITIFFPMGQTLLIKEM